MIPSVIDMIKHMAVPKAQKSPASRTGMMGTALKATKPMMVVTLVIRHGKPHFFMACMIASFLFSVVINFLRNMEMI